MFCCIYNTETKEIAHDRFIDKNLELEWPMYELECMNRGGSWRPYKGDVFFCFPEEAPVEPKEEE